MLYEDDKGINDAARPPEGGPAEAGDLSASSLPLNIECLARMPDSPLKASVLSTVANQADICLCFPPDRTWHKVNDPKVNYNGD